MRETIVETMEIKRSSDNLADMRLVDYMSYAEIRSFSLTLDIHDNDHNCICYFR